MKKHLLFSLSLLTGLSLSAQTDDAKHCGHTEAYEQLFESNPGLRELHEAEQAEFQESYEVFMNSWSPDDRATYIIPVVVHIVHLDGPENISDEQVYSAIDQLNLDFSESNADLSATIPDFAGITGNADIEFRLAKKDPWGGCTKGITRTYSSTTYDTGISGSSHPIVEAVQDEHGTWPQNKYLNIFVCIDPNGNAGYTFKPGGWYPVSGMYGGIQIDYKYFGTIEEAYSFAEHTLSHEVGHWLNLNHTWGNSNSPGDPANCDINDGVGDTPNTIGWTSCNLAGTTCGSLDNVQNIMEYSYCSTMFTDGQCGRMQNALTSGTAGRNNLSSGSNLTATGVLTAGELCEADFLESKTVVCAGGSVDFEDVSYYNVTGWNWTFEGGTPSTSTDPNPTVTYNTGGTYNVTLQVTDGSSFETVIKNDHITVLPVPGESLPYHEGFEAVTSMSNGEDFILINENSAEEWAVTSTASASGSKSVWLDNHGNSDGSKDAFISAPIDLSGIDPADDMILTFEYAYKKRSASNNEYLRFYISADCGESWALRENLDSDELNTETQSGAYTPADQGEWKMVTIDNITNTYYQEDFQFKFEFINDNGNNLFIDNINLYAASMVDLLEHNNATSIKLYPNPAKDNVLLTLESAISADYSITLYSTLGARLMNIYQGEIEAGQKQFEFSTQHLPVGIYIVKVENAGEVETIKLVKE